MTLTTVTSGNFPMEETVRMFERTGLDLALLFNEREDVVWATFEQKASFERLSDAEQGKITGRNNKMSGVNAHQAIAKLRDAFEATTRTQSCLVVINAKDMFNDFRTYTAYQWSAERKCGVAVGTIVAGPDRTVTNFVPLERFV